ncbi:MAG: DUF2846 domain-containing protein [Methyloversatilis sp.]|uniref:DUF2846 domain-containing protein n=1 Tax=Methyloversatilis sp. TaxID=2569862 RepID=UPI0027323AC9|nr:DUF2846 domain-containing protein [Methyloversatilis sp.]MDP3871469.1 DUF2846 domain-containing protein [Methyloversatilis sp.]
MKYRTFAVIAATAVLAGCAAVPQHRTDAGTPPGVAEISPGKAGVYVFRTGYSAPALPIAVLLDGEPIGSTVSQTHLFKEIEPGRHTLGSQLQFTSKLEFDAKPGQIVYVRQDLWLGYLQVHTRLRKVHPDDGARAVRTTKLAVSR